MIAFVCLFVCLFLCPVIFACSGVLDLFSIGLGEIALVNKLAFLRSVFQSDHSEAKKYFHSGQLDCWLERMFTIDDLWLKMLISLTINKINYQWHSRLFSSTSHS